MIKKTISVIVAVPILFGYAAGPVEAAETYQPRNEVVIIIDGSGSFKSRQAKAVERTVTLLEDISEQKLRRWEEARDRVVIISLDALPEVIWDGNLHDLKATESSQWSEHFRARTDYANCTDVGSAFQLATRHLDGDPKQVSRYLFVFSDLIDEPPRDSMNRCHPARMPSPPPENFPWEKLGGVAVNIFWVPPNQKLVWRRAVDRHGLDESFALFTTSESGATPILPPEPARLAPEIIEEQREATAQQLKEVGSVVLKWAGVIGGLIFSILFFSILMTVRASRGRSKRQGTAPPAGSRITGPVPPLKLPRHQGPPEPNGPIPGARA